MRAVRRVQKDHDAHCLLACMCGGGGRCVARFAVAWCTLPLRGAPCCRVVCMAHPADAAMMMRSAGSGVSAI
eukprot:363994-Chlamydomonas_euryale.AAC.11